MFSANKLQHLIFSSKITKDKLCKEAKIGRPTLDAILKGGDTKISTIEALAQALHVHAWELFDDTPELTAGTQSCSNVDSSKNAEAKILNDSDFQNAEQTISSLKMQLQLMQNILEEKERLIKILLSNKK